MHLEREVELDFSCCKCRVLIIGYHVLSLADVFLQAGTQFWDEKLDNELAEGRLSGASFDRYLTCNHSFFLVGMQMP